MYCSPECHSELEQYNAWAKKLREKSPQARGVRVFFLYLVAAFLLAVFLTWVFWMGVIIRGQAPDLFK
jgi:hypothetical protein